MKLRYFAVLFFISLWLNLFSNISYKELTEGYIPQDSLGYQVDELFKLNGKSYDLRSQISRHPHSLLIHISPYICGGMENLDYEFLNEMANKYPEQIYIVLSDFDHDYTKKAVKNSLLSKNIRILTDKEEKVFKRYKDIDKGLKAQAYFMLDNQGTVKYIVFQSRVSMDKFKDDSTKEYIEKLLK